MKEIYFKRDLVLENNVRPEVINNETDNTEVYVESYIG